MITPYHTSSFILRHISRACPARSEQSVLTFSLHINIGEHFWHGRVWWNGDNHKYGHNNWIAVCQKKHTLARSLDIMLNVYMYQIVWSIMKVFLQSLSLVLFDALVMHCEHSPVTTILKCSPDSANIGTTLSWKIWRALPGPEKGFIKTSNFLGGLLITCVTSGKKNIKKR